MARHPISRREFLTALPAVALLPQQLRGARAKITDVRVIQLRTVKELGSLVDFRGGTRSYRVGGGAFVEIHTDQGLTGIGPAMEQSLVQRVKAELVGKDPFDIERQASQLYAIGRQAGPGGYTGTASAEIALWDLIGKAANQPLYKLWGGVKDRIVPYASQLRLSTIEERADTATKLKSEGWKAIKLRNRFPTLKEDIRLVEAVRKATGDDFVITADANQAGNSFLSEDVTWDLPRAISCARAYHEMGVYWLEEPLPRYAFDQIAELNRVSDCHIAGGEANRGLHEFKLLLERGCYDIVQPEVNLEGPTTLRKVAILAESMGKLCIPHVGSTLGNICDMHLVASWPNAPYFEIFNDPPFAEMQYSNAIYEEPPVFKDGYLHLPDKPGLGVAIDKALIMT